MIADLRSDTLTTPTPAMRQAMAQAPVGDDVYGEDPTVARLEEKVADLLGHEAALFFPTGSLANQAGLWLHAGQRQGLEIIADQLAHVLRAELGAGATFSGISSRTWRAPRGLLDDSALEMIEELIVPDGGPHQVTTAAVVIENTHNFGGGTIQPLQMMSQLRARTAQVGVGIHLDGARLWNAHVATGVSLADYGACADTISVCLSKGLGAPVGSVLVASAEKIAAARVWRKRMGAGMRQVGILAAAGSYAIDHHLDRMAEDHRRARWVAERIAAVHPDVVDVAHVQTNILVLDVGSVGWAAADFIEAAGARGVRGYATSRRQTRFVWHVDIDDAMTEHAAVHLVELLEQGPEQRQH